MTKKKLYWNIYLEFNRVLNSMSRENNELRYRPNGNTLSTDTNYLCSWNRLKGTLKW